MSEEEGNGGPKDRLMTTEEYHEFDLECQLQACKKILQILDKRILELEAIVGQIVVELNNS